MGYNKMMRKFILFAAIAALLPATAEARPVSYPGGWTFMTTNDVDENSVHVHYSPSAHYAVGWRHDYLRDTKTNVDTALLNLILKRWNLDGSQANLYLQSGAGIAYDSDETNPAAFTGITADWENRRLLVSYENRFFTAGSLDSFAEHTARVGVAPYIGDYGDLHTWLMVEGNYDAGNEDSFSLTPLVRLFKGTTLIEAGYNLDDGALFNFVQQF